MDLPTILLILSAMSIGATVIAVLVALRSAREARTAIFPIVKEEESVRARRARVSIMVWLAITAILLGGWLAALQLTSSSEPSDAATAANPPVSPATDVVAFDTEEPRQEPSPAELADTPTEPANTVEITEPPTEPPATATLLPTPTPVPPTNPTDTPAPTVVPASPTPTRKPLGPAPENTELGPIEFATEVSDSPIAAVNPSTTFSTGARIYAVYSYSGMQNNVTFSAVWYRNNTEIARDDSPWEWGWQGNSYSFLLPPGEGSYKLELYVNDTLLTTGSFEVR